MACAQSIGAECARSACVPAAPTSSALYPRGLRLTASFPSVAPLQESIFPVQEAQAFPENFEAYAKDIFKRLFRVYAIIYHRHFDTINGLEAAAHLNTCFKHYMFFVFEFKLVDGRELKALKGPTENLLAQFSEQVGASASASAPAGGS